MPSYVLTPAAVDDLKEIAHYTLKHWGRAQSLRYAAVLEKRFSEIAAHSVVERRFSTRLPDVVVTRCEHHFIFYIGTEKAVPRIVAVLHERMDVVSCSLERTEVADRSS